MPTTYSIIFEANYAKYGELHVSNKEIEAENLQEARKEFIKWAKGRYHTLNIISASRLDF